MNDRDLILSHLRHLTDGRWHDDCGYCRERRARGGVGVPEAEVRAAKLSLAKERYAEAMANGWTVVAMHDGNWSVPDVEEFIKADGEPR